MIVARLKRLVDKLRWIVQNFRKINRLTPPVVHFLGPVTYCTDSLVTSNNCDFITEPRFARAYATALATQPWEGFTLQWRVYICCWFANHVKQLEGDFVECGVNTGAYSRAVIEYIDFASLSKTFYLFDTFEGLVRDQISEEEMASGIGIYLTHYENVYEQIKKTFSPFNTEIIKGVVPDSLSKCGSQKVCYLSIDMNCVYPEIAAINYFWDRLVSGAVVILDDYGFPMHIHQKQAFDEFAREKQVEILSLPTGQGIMFHP